MAANRHNRSAECDQPDVQLKTKQSDNQPTRFQPSQQNNHPTTRQTKPSLEMRTKMRLLLLLLSLLPFLSTANPYWLDMDSRLLESKNLKSPDQKNVDDYLLGSRQESTNLKNPDQKQVDPYSIVACDCRYSFSQLPN